MFRQGMLAFFAISATPIEGEHMQALNIKNDSITYIVCVYTGSWGCTSGFMNKDLLVRRASKISSEGSISPNFLSSNQFLVIPGMGFTCMQWDNHQLLTGSGCQEWKN